MALGFPNASAHPSNSRNPHNSRKSIMTILSPRHILPDESIRLGVESGWYSTKVSGTFVTGPHATLEECVSKIAELNPPPAKRRP
jgi:hypothetical protein